MNWKKGDLLVIAVVLAVALLLLGMRALPAVAEERVLRIELNGEIVREVLLKEDVVQSITVPLSKGNAIVEIENGRARMLPMSKELCPQGICSHVGWAERSGDIIVCLPNRLVLTVVGGGPEEVLDGVTQ